MDRQASRKWPGRVALVSLALALLACALSGAKGVWEAGAQGAQGRPPVRASGTATTYASSVTIDTYNYAGYLENAYDGAYNMHYKVLDWGDYGREVRTKAPKTYPTIVIENDVGTEATPDMTVAWRLPPELEFVSGRSDRQAGVRGTSTSAQSDPFTLGLNERITFQLQVRVLTAPANGLVKTHAIVLRTLDEAELASESESTTLKN